jgi:hypothetical protein
MRGEAVEDVRLEIGGKPLKIVSVKLTFGTRHYWLCPRCGRRCEAVYFLGKYAGCRVCLHLGYRSQCHAPGTPWRWLDNALLGRWGGWSGGFLKRYKASKILAAPSFMEALEVGLRATAERWVKEILEHVEDEANKR